MSEKLLKLTLSKSLAGRPKTHQSTLRCLGLSRIRQAVTVVANPRILGQVAQIRHMIVVEECSNAS